MSQEYEGIIIGIHKTDKNICFKTIDKKGIVWCKFPDNFKDEVVQELKQVKLLDKIKKGWGGLWYRTETGEIGLVITRFEIIKTPEEEKDEIKEWLKEQAVKMQIPIEEYAELCASVYTKHVEKYMLDTYAGKFRLVDKKTKNEGSALNNYTNKEVNI